jgi:4-amino-4-deoxy-L-arabinose transferase-like glycosyltransferase
MGKRDLGLLLLAGALLLVPAAAAVDVFNPDEPRESEIAREMRASGDPVVPRFDGCAFLEKPPLFYWCALAAAKLPLGIPELEMRLPSILAALGLLGVTYVLGRELFDRRTGRAGAALLLTTFQFWWLGKRALLDMALAFFVGAVMLAFLLGYRRPSRRTAYFLIGGAAAAGAVLTKGLIGLLIPGVAIAAYLLWRREARVLVSWPVLAAALVPLAAAGVWVALLAGRPDGACYVREFLVENHVKRFIGGGYGGHRQPFWYYIESLATDFQPWVLFLPSAAAALWPGWRPAPRHGSGAGDGETRDDAGSAAFLWSWLLPALVVLSLASAKRSIYLLPLTPALALLVAAWWRGRGARAERRGRTSRWAVVPALILAALGLLVAAGVPLAIAALLAGGEHLSVRGHWEALVRDPSGVPLGAALLLAIVALVLLARRRRARAAAGAVVTVFAFLFVAGTVLIPIAGPRLSARAFGEAIGDLRSRGTRVAAAGLTEGSLGQFLYYSRGTLEWIAREGPPANPCVECREPVSAAVFLAGPGRRAVLMRSKDFAALPAEVVRGGRVRTRGRVGGAEYVLFETTSPGARPTLAPATPPEARRSP